MKIAYIMYPGACYLGAGDGQKMQAEIWLKELERKGHQVDRINSWGHYDWKSYDVIHVFGFGLWNYDMIHWGSGINPNFVFSPIIDTNIPMWKYRLATYVGCSKLRLYTQNYALRQLKPDIKIFFARSEYEANYLRHGYGIEENKIAIVPLSYRETNYDPTVKKEPFCLFAGTMTQPRKNVPRLIEAAKKYGFPLKLVGNTGNTESEAQLRALVDNAPDIEILGFVSDDELSSLYNRAKVFALPSINEGVGLVALEAAICGCNIVITNLGGPKEYYEKGTAELVNPYDINDIGKAVLRAFDNTTAQPKLRNTLIKKYNVSTCVDKLIDYYQQI
ncbi:MAG: glycosyltransferase family 4 protein [Prevotella sp.]|nr:glycosyltransferase family 4 protein [Prevotella sp.]